MEQLRTFLKDETGATGIEYGVIVAGLVMSLIVVFESFEESFTGVYDDICAGLDNCE